MKAQKKTKKRLNGDDLLELESFKKMENPLMDLIAESAIWVDPSRVPQHPIYPNVRRGYHDEKKKTEIAGIYIDDNTYANHAIKRAISKNIEFENYITCHIWPGTPYDVRYHTQLANLVLIPRALAGLSDHFAGVIDVLKYRSWELYGFYPAGENQPQKPSYYPEKWRPFEEDDEIIDLEDYLLKDHPDDLALETYNANREEIEIEKVHKKVPKWISNPDQICSTILNDYMYLSDNDSKAVFREELKSLSEDRVEKFEVNYNQMKNFGIRNHAKVFDDKNGYIRLWDPVALFIREEYSK